ncbi:MAG: CocE/NonD family hydrolase [Synechococcales cyanobacterium]
MLAVRPPETHSLTTADGVRLDADVYRPEAPGEYPVLLMRQPYGRRIASTVVYAHPSWYASHGYVVVIQDVRGRGTSEGTFQLFASETEDGAASVAWAAQLPGSSGQVGMYGFSYQGMTQLYAAAARPAALRTLCPAMCVRDPYSEWAYHNGALCLENTLSWAIQLSAESARLARDPERFRALQRLAQAPPYGDPQPLGTLDPESFWHQWLAHPTRDPYWHSLTPDLSQVDLPMLHIGGWWDPYWRGTLSLYQERCHHSTAPQHLWVGPWPHLPWGRHLHQLDFGAAAVSPIDQVQIRWFDQVLKGIDTGLWQEDAVHLYVVGEGQGKGHWRSFPTWPQPPSQRWFLQGQGLAAIQGGSLSPLPSEVGIPDVVVHDPWRPVPSRAFGWDRAAIDGRSDVLTYTTDPLEQDVELWGSPVLRLWIVCDHPSWDLSATLSYVLPAGAVFALSQDYGRWSHPPNAAAHPITLTLSAIGARIGAGSSLRLSLSASQFPAYPVNDGQGSPLPEWIDLPVITIQVCRGELDLPWSPVVSDRDP